MLDTIIGTPRIPIEVTERIVDYVHDLRHDGWDLRQQYGTWKACALTCRAMRPRSQSWLFRKILLQSERQAKSLKAILKDNKAVAKEVRILVLGGPSQRDNAAGKAYGWISWAPLAFSALMTNLRQLELHNITFVKTHPRFLSSIATFKSVRRLSLLQVELSRFQQGSDLIGAFPQLRHIDLSRISWSSDPVHLEIPQVANQPSNSRRRRLIVHLDVSGSQSQVRRIYQWLSDWETLRDIKTFNGMEDSFGTLMQYKPSDGYHLWSVFLCMKEDTFIQVPANALNELRIFHIDIWNGDFPIKVLTSVLSSAPRTLREVAVYVMDPDPEYPRNSISDYIALDAWLANSHRRELKMTVCLYTGYTLKASIETEGRWRQWLLSKLPIFCAGEGKLTVTSRSTLKFPSWRWMDDRDGLYNLDE